MNIEQELLKEHSKAQANQIANYVDCDQEKFDVLMQMFFHKNMRIHQRAAMAVGICSERYPFLIEPYLELMLKNLKNPVHDAIIRNTIRTFQNIELPEDLWSDAWEICFDYLSDPKIPVAIRAFAMTVLYNICRVLPELKNELQIVIEDQLPYGSAGFKSRGSKILNLLKRIK